MQAYVRPWAGADGIRAPTVSFVYPQALGNSKNTEVVRFKYSREIVSSIGHIKQSKDMWGIKTETYQKVALTNPELLGRQQAG